MELNGEQCLMIYHHGQQYITTIEAGQELESGSKLIKNC